MLECLSVLLPLLWRNNLFRCVQMLRFVYLSPVDGHLDCFCLLAFGSSAARSMCVQVSVCSSVGYCTEELNC